MADSKYGFRCEDVMAVDLIRSAFDPDPYPEVGEHKFRLALGVSGVDGAELIAEAARWNHPLHVISGSQHDGTMPLSRSLMGLSGGAMISGVKLCEDEDALLVRLMDVDGSGVAQLSFDREIERAVMVDTLERETGGAAAVSGTVIALNLGKYRVGAVKVRFK